MRIDFGPIMAGRSMIADHVAAQRAAKPGYRVIDMGGIAINGAEDLSGNGSWTRGIADFIVDINAPVRPDCIAMDLCDPDSWSAINDFVAREGKFDYAICTHTLEDIYDPIIALKRLPQVAHAGVVTMPSARTELSNVESRDWLGYMHHRWIFDEQDGAMLIAPKLSWIEKRYTGRMAFAPGYEEIRYHWEGDIPFRLFMNNYLGPNATTVLNEYDRMVGNIARRAA